MPYYSMASGKHLHGLHSIMAYRNRDGQLAQRNCGLAAAATALRYKERYMGETLAALEERFPPDILLGLCVTSKARVCEILSAYGCHRHEVEGQQALKHALHTKLTFKFQGRHYRLTDVFGNVVKPVVA
jgi:hypothetical protein